MANTKRRQTLMAERRDQDVRFKAKQVAAQAAAMSAGGHRTAMRSPSSPSGSYFQEDYGLGTPRSWFCQSPDYNDGDYGGFHPDDPQV